MAKRRSARKRAASKPRERLPIVNVKVPRCGNCGSDHLVSFRSEANGDGTRTKYVACQLCGHRFKQIVE